MQQKIFYDIIREEVFKKPLTQDQVNGINVILKGWKEYGKGNRQELAYLLATTAWETAWTMQPIYERGKVSYFKKYEPGTPIGKNLGNTNNGDGYRYRGRGFVQLTGRRNYANAGQKLNLDLVTNPDLALNPEVAAKILIIGSTEGWFTGKGLDKYIDDEDESDFEDRKEFLQARRVVNGQDKTATIADLAIIFERALRLGDEEEARIAAKTIPAKTETDKTVPTAKEGQPPYRLFAVIGTMIAAAIPFILNIFGVDING